MLVIINNILTGLILFLLGASVTIVPYLSTDDAVKYLDPAYRFKLIMWLAGLQGGLTAVKALLTIPKPRNGNGNGHPVT